MSVVFGRRLDSFQKPQRLAGEGFLTSYKGDRCRAYLSESHLFLLNLIRTPVLSMSATATVAKRAVGKLRPETTAMLLVDIQERFRPLIYNGETVVRTAQYMTSVAKALDIPVVATQQYTKVFGETVPDCFATQADLEATPIYEKKLFSMCTEQVSEHLTKLNRSSFIVFGIEAHVCVQQTALDLLEVSSQMCTTCLGILC